jgi:glycosyltransferase involved in cell wall biosynthesis
VGKGDWEIDIRRNAERPEKSRALSVVVTSYNDLDILEANLAAYARQSFRDFEIVVADDGSREDYRPVLKRWARYFRQGILHVKHEDRGFRRARIINRAIHESRFPWLVFADMDCLPHRRYLENHARYLVPGTMITGRRAHVTRAAVPVPDEILRRGLGLGLLRLVRLWLQGQARVVEHGVVLPMFYESWFNCILGSNFSACRVDLEAVNGFNEEFLGYGWEDTDLDSRLRRNGIRVRNLRNKVVQFHLSHPQRSGDNTRNREVIERSDEQGTIRAAVGLAEIRPDDHECTRYEGALQSL